MYIGILLRLLFGFVRIEIEGYYIERFINICQNKRIIIWNLKREKGVKLFLNIGIKDLKKLKPIVRKTNCKLKIRKKRGIPFFMYKYKKRKVFIISLIVISILIYSSTRYIWNIEINVEENHIVPNIEKDLYDLGLKKGILKNKIETGKIINEIRLKRNDISWMGIDIKGTNAVIRIIKADEKPELIDESDYCDIVATKSGIITKIIAQNGTALVKVGDTVSKGDTLIAGYMEGNYTEKRYVHSLGEVQAKVTYRKSEKISLNQEELRETGEKEKRIKIKLNNFQINFYKTLSKFKIYDTIYSEKKFKVFSNYYLPISLIEIINKEQITETKIYSKEEAIEFGKEKLSREIENKIEKKENIQDITIDTNEQEEYIEVCVTYVVLENIESYQKLEV